ncbi:uncharacterized protein LOC117116788 [Anneissia japonica]|uniref:uncharacterized protein LOC117116788 n=1 Tax=Anneissia japonica TaxID=1529436 RepID=UPI00142593FC|nr:uncharacterized protein LOC117116788 [Anneissia japonica]
MSARRLSTKVPTEALVYFEFDESTSIVPTKKLHGEVKVNGVVDITYSGKHLTCQIIALSNDNSELVDLDADFWKTKNSTTDTTTKAVIANHDDNIQESDGNVDDVDDELPAPKKARVEVVDDADDVPTPKKAIVDDSDDELLRPAPEVAESHDDSIQEFVNQTIETLLPVNRMFTIIVFL